MLTRLYIENFALIKKVEIEFGPGLNIITGETGAGKSILIGALNAILGGPAGGDLVRAGGERAAVEALFEFDEAPAGLEGELEDGQLVLRRELTAKGRSRALVNGAVRPLKQVRALGAALVDLHGQHDHQSLLDNKYHRHFLDAFGRLGKSVEAVGNCYRAYRESQRSLRHLEEEGKALEREAELRAFQLDEIRRLAPEPGEEERLERDLNVLENLENLGQAASRVQALLYQDEGSVVEQLGAARRLLEPMVQVDGKLETHNSALESLIYGIEDLASGLRGYLDQLEPDPERLEQARERLDALRRLKKKHGGDLAAVLELASGLENQESRLEELAGKIGQQRRHLQEQLARFDQACQKLSAGRQRAAAKLENAVAKGLRGLGHPQAGFGAQLCLNPEPNGLLEREGALYRADEQGLETAQFQFCANAGETLRPLDRIASGGELSRVMLVLKSSIAERDQISTLVFDEIDAGISGRVAAAVGRKLEALAVSHQAIVITHLPQIASRAHQHFSVRKNQRGGRTLTEVHLLDDGQRAEEIAALLAGETVSATARKHAKEMLE